MRDPIWTIAEICAAAGAQIEGVAGDQNVTGISIDTRTLEPGDLFVPLSANRDGHAFVDAAFDAGAACAFVRKEFESKPNHAGLLRVEDPFRALENLAKAARARLKYEATTLAVTGSVGKTGTKEMLRTAFSPFGKTHAAVKSFNNHWGVPLTLARTPRDCATAIYEIGMNHAGEISPLTQLVQPNIAIITTVAPVHLEFFDSVDDIARAKAEIFDGLMPGGFAILNRDNQYFDFLRTLAEEKRAEVVAFGHDARSAVRLLSAEPVERGTAVVAEIAGTKVSFNLEIPGGHVAQNAMAVLAALHVAGCDVEEGARALGELTAGAGRGARASIQVPGGQICVIDESYNANPASMAAALHVLGQAPHSGRTRRIAVLGDMLELGRDSATLHARLADEPAMAKVDLVFACGQNMRALFDALPPAQRGRWAVDAKSLAVDVVAALQPGDTVMVKGSLGSDMAQVLSAIRKAFQV